MLFAGDNGQCVNYSRALSGLQIKGNAIDWTDDVNANEPELGAVVVFYYGHLAVVTEIDYLNHTITITERNYKGVWNISERTIPWNSEDIVGYVIK